MKFDECLILIEPRDQEFRSLDFSEQMFFISILGCVQAVLLEGCNFIFSHSTDLFDSPCAHSHLMPLKTQGNFINNFVLILGKANINMVHGQHGRRCVCCSCFAIGIRDLIDRLNDHHPRSVLQPHK